MQAFSDNTNWESAPGGRRFWSFDLSAWALLALGAVLAFATLNYTMVQPNVRQLTALQAQIATLESTVRLLADERGTVSGTNTLLCQLAEQGRRNVAADKALSDISVLHERLNAQTQRAAEALTVMEKLAALQDRLLQNAAQIELASDSLSAIEMLESRLVGQQFATDGSHRSVDALDQLRSRLLKSDRQTAGANASLDEIDALRDRLTVECESNPAAQQSLDGLVQIKRTVEYQGSALATAWEVLQQWTRLQEKLAGSRPQTAEARLSADELFGLTDDLVCRGGNLPGAQEALDGLVDIRRTLDNQSSGLSLAHERVEQLIDLKDRTLSQTHNLADATANLELMTDVQDQLGKLAANFGRMRHWITEILTFEPVLNSAMRSLQPLSELGNLRHLSADQLRQVIRTLDERRAPQYSGSPASDATTSGDGSTLVPPVVESARAK